MSRTAPSRDEPEKVVVESTATSGRSGHLGRKRSGGVISSKPALWGLIAFGIVLALRLGGLIVGPVAVVVAIGSFALLPGPKRLADRAVMCFAVFFGWLPLVGWLPGLGTSVDVPGVFLSTGAGIACAHQVAQGRRWGGIARVTVAEGLSIELGALVALWWWAPFSRLPTSGRLASLFPGYDNATHFDMFRQNIVLGSFVSVRPHTSSGALRLGYDYPQGVYQAWAQLARFWNPHPPTGNLEWSLNAYIAILLVTLALIVSVGCLNIARLCERNLAVAAPGMAMIVALLVAGRLWIFNGYPNFTVAIVASAIAVCVAWRPTSRPGPNYITVAGLSLVAAYTWYPIFLVGLPAIVIAGLRWRPTRVRFRRKAMVAVVGVSIVLLLSPVLVFGHRGLNTLSNTGHAQWTAGTSWALVVLSICGLCAFALALSTSGIDRTALTLVWPALLAGIGVLALSGLEIRSTHRINYYGQKFAVGAFAFCTIVLVTAAVAFLTDVQLRVPRAATAVISGLAVICVLQIDGYVGPGTTQTGATLARGLAFRQHLRDLTSESRPAGDVLVAVQLAERYQAIHPSRNPSQWWYVNPNDPVLCGLGEDWFADLLGEPTIPEYTTALSSNGVSCGFGSNPKTAADYVVQRFVSPVEQNLHFIVPADVARLISSQDSEWLSPGLLLTIPHS